MVADTRLQSDVFVVEKSFLMGKIMPTVGSKKFAYTPQGEAQAKAFAKKTGKKMVRRNR